MKTGQIRLTRRGRQAQAALLLAMIFIGPSIPGIVGSLLT